MGVETKREPATDPVASPTAAPGRRLWLGRGRPGARAVVPRAMAALERPPLNLNHSLPRAEDLGVGAVRDFLVRIGGLLYLAGAALYLVRLALPDLSDRSAWLPPI